MAARAVSGESVGVPGAFFTGANSSSRRTSSSAGRSANGKVSKMNSSILMPCRRGAGLVWHRVALSLPRMDCCGCLVNRPLAHERLLASFASNLPKQETRGKPALIKLFFIAHMRCKRALVTLCRSPCGSGSLKNQEFPPLQNGQCTNALNVVAHTSTCSAARGVPTTDLCTLSVCI